ncbi:HalOD1 output domain-containing protein [halophilic archaeon]|uniref:HalOD1 output domain-containing protein n=1 Tax=Halomicrococcus sp. SG-WS-1 TaxID=3439057 RepID=UPI000DDCFD70|nr:hypothetical protein DMJ13_09540 [halophilic archaeon]
MSKTDKNAWSAGPRSGTYHTQHDWDESEPLSTTVMTAVAEAMDEDPTEMDPLYDRFDPDALDCLFRPMADGVPPAGGHVSFTFKGYRVFIQSDGHIAIHPPEN